MSEYSIPPGGGGGPETDPVFGAAEAALFAAGDKAKLDTLEALPEWIDDPLGQLLDDQDPRKLSIDVFERECYSDQGDDLVPSIDWQNRILQGNFYDFIFPVIDWAGHTCHNNVGLQTINFNFCEMYNGDGFSNPNLDWNNCRLMDNGSYIISWQGGLGFFNATPVPQSTGWGCSNYAFVKGFDADSTTLDEVADCLGTLIFQLALHGLIGF